MSWKLTIAQRIRAGAALIVVFLLILATNMIDSNHFEVVQKSMTSIYEDRLIGKQYIYLISRQLDTKQNLLQVGQSADANNINQAANEEIRELMGKLGLTKLTESEAKRLKQLKIKLDRLFSDEKRFGMEEVVDQEMPELDEIESYYTGIYEELDALSEIQVREGQREVFFSTRSIESSNLISRIEIGVLVVLGLLFQLLIFVRPQK